MTLYSCIASLHRFYITCISEDKDVVLNPKDVAYFKVIPGSEIAGELLFLKSA